MTTPQSEIDEIYKTLNGENIEFLRDTVAFGVAWRIVEYNDPSLLAKMPAWVGELVMEMCQSYLQHGKYGYVSNLGEVDHSELFSKLVRLLDLSK